MSVSIKLLRDFVDYIDKLPQSKRAILDSRIFFLESTGFLGNLKILEGNLFEFPIVELKEKLFCSIGESNTITLSIDREKLKHFSLINDVADWDEKHFESLKDIKYAKRFYNEILKIFKDTGEDYFFTQGLNNIFRSLGQQNFKIITGYDYKDLETNPQIKTLNDLIKRIRLLIKFKSLSQIAEKSKVPEDRIVAILGVKANIDLKDMENLIKLCSKAIGGGK